MADAVSAGASILAFVLLGLKSVKAARETLASFKDGPDNVKKARSDVEKLRLVLERLSHCRILDAPGTEALRADIVSCFKDIQTFDNKLKQLVPKARSPHRAKYWKRFMAMWDEEALSKMSMRLTNHIASLNFHLNVLQRYKNFLATLWLQCLASSTQSTRSSPRNE
ncbi:hypothetical protein P885DRAFT_64274 [Corynascus similis CBS 632.67]